MQTPVPLSAAEAKRSIELNGEKSQLFKKKETEVPADNGGFFVPVRRRAEVPVSPSSFREKVICRGQRVAHPGGGRAGQLHPGVQAGEGQG